MENAKISTYEFFYVECKALVEAYKPEKLTHLGCTQLTLDLFKLFVQNGRIIHHDGFMDDNVVDFIIYQYHLDFWAARTEKITTNIADINYSLLDRLPTFFSGPVCLTFVHNSNGFMIISRIFDPTPYNTTFYLKIESVDDLIDVYCRTVYCKAPVDFSFVKSCEMPHFLPY